MQQKFKVMAYHHSTGFWNHCRQVSLNSVIEYVSESLSDALAAWQADYDAQFRKFTYEFDWDTFNKRGYDLAEHIQELAPDNALVYYVESDDRDFFNPEDCLKHQAQS